MKLTKFEKYLIETHKKFDEIGLVHWLIGSTLLGAFREKRIIKGDIEVNFGVRVEDLMRNLDTLKKYYKIIYTPSVFVMSGIYLVEHDYEDDIWDHPIGFTWIPPYFRSLDKMYQVPSGHSLFYWDTEDIYPLKTHSFLGHKFLIPRKPITYMNKYFGRDWRKPNSDWHWSKDAKNHLNVKGIIC